jgi:hypothetical protein
MKKLLLLVICCSLFVTSAYAKEQTHDGFFLRMALGGGRMVTKSGDVTIADSNGSSSLTIGGALSENTILHVEYASVSKRNPSIKWSDFKGRLNGRLHTGLLGLGITHYFMPANAYVSATVGTASTTIESTGTFESDNGLGAKVMLGKEWWVSDNWGLGIAGQVFYADCDGGLNGSKDIKTLVYGLLFSATYN